MIMLILNDNGGKIYIINELFNKPEGISFASTEKLIKCALYKNHSFLGYGEVKVSKEAKWINFSNTMSSMTNNTELQEITQLRLKCSIVEMNAMRNSKPVMSNHHNRIKPTNELMQHSMIQNKSKSISIKEALLSPGTYVSKKNSSVTMQTICKRKKYSKGNLKPLIRKNKDKYHNSNKTCTESSYENNTLITCDGNNTSYMNATLKTNTNKRKISSEMKSSHDDSALFPAQMPKNKRNNTSAYIYSSSKKPSIISQSQDKLNLFANKLEDQFESIEERIVDKKFENNICKDEIIIYQEKSLNYCTPCSSDDDEEKNNDESFKALYKENQNNNESEFEHLKEDLDIFYTKEYLQRITNEVIFLELQLFIDKMCHLQEAYHIELGNALRSYTKRTGIFQTLCEQYVLLKKSVNKLKDKNDLNITRQVMNNYIVTLKTKQDKEIIDANSKELEIWKRLNLVVKQQPNLLNKEIKSIGLINIFATIIKKHKGLIDDGLLCDKIIEKYNIENKMINNNNDSNTNSKPKQKEITSFPSPIALAQTQPSTQQKKKSKIKNSSIPLKKKLK